MKQSSLIVLFFTVFGMSLNGQILNNRLDFKMSAGKCNTTGNAMISEKGFIIPALYSNYNKVNKFAAELIYRPGNLFSFGASIHKVMLENWQNEGFFLYSNATSNVLLFGPTIQIHTGYSDSGVFNRLKVYFELSVLIGTSELDLESPVSYPYSDTGDELPGVLGIKNFTGGLEAKTGVELILTNNLGLFSSYGYSVNAVKSSLYSDRTFSYTSMNFGFFFRLFHDKHFYY